MSDPKFNKNLCIGCGTCVSECSFLGISAIGKGNIPYIFYPNTCIQCGHCIAVCPTNAVTHVDFDMNNCRCIANLPNPEEVAELFKSKRSVRQFKNKPIEKELIAQIISVASYAPSDLNSQNRSFYVLTNKEKLANLEEAIVHGFENYVEQALKSGLPINSYEILLSKEIINEYARGGKPIFKNAPCVLFIYGPSDTSELFAPFNAITANTYAMIYAHSLGVESCIIGRALYDTVSLAAYLGIPEQMKIYSVITLGYPKIKYKKLVDRNPKEIIWN